MKTKRKQRKVDQITTGTKMKNVVGIAICTEEVKDPHFEDQQDARPPPKTKLDNTHIKDTHPASG